MAVPSVMAKWAPIFLVLTTATAVLSRQGCRDTDRAPAPHPLQFCAAYKRSACCGSERDAQLAAQFTEFALHPRESQRCAHVLRRVLCSECDPQSHLLFSANRTASQPVPFLCRGGLCERAYRLCKDLRIPGSPFVPRNGTIAEAYPTLEHFSAAFCSDPANQEGHCFSGGPRGQRRPRPLSRELQSTAPQLCFERVSDATPLNLVGHPAANNYALMGDKQGLIQLVSIPAVGSRSPIQVVATWLDLSARVMSNSERGLLSFAFHPKYLSNGRFFVSYICDGSKIKDCQGPCACNAGIGCSLGSKGAGCNGNTVIAEYRVPSPRNVSSTPSPTEAKRFLTYGRPYSNHNGGDIFFGLSGFLFITSGDGGSQGDPFNAAQAGSSHLGKIHRIDVDKASPGKNYSIPSTNPFVGKAGVLPEIFALGFRNPWRCAVDSKLGKIFCGDVGQNRVEEIDVIVSGRNYGWSRLEGSVPYNAAIQTPIGKLQGPLFQYAHYGTVIPGIPVGGNAVIGGVVYRGPRNKCLQGKYLYNDLEGAMWVGTVSPPKGKRASTSMVTAACAANSALPCSSGSFGVIWSWGVDSRKDAFMLGTNGVYRLTDLSRCGVTC